MASPRLKVGLALGGGSARGLAHIGVLEVLEREGIPIDMIAGTSAGALVGALYAREKDAARLKQQAMALDWVAFTSLVDLTLPKNGFISGKRVTSLLRRFLGEVDFKDLEIPLSCTATDIISGDEVILNSGSVIDAVRASISIPVIFAVAKYQDRFLVDGGLVNPVPVKTVKDMGADFIIAVDVTPDKSERSTFLRTHAEIKEPSMFQVIVQTIYIATYYSARIASEEADEVIHPRLAHISPGEFHRANELILEGELAAVDSLPRIKRRLAEAGIHLKSAGNFIITT